MVKRIVTAEGDGGSTVATDGPAPVFDMGGGACVHEIWLAPHPDGAYPPGQDWSLNPPPGGSVFRIAEFPPATPGEQAYMHRTPTIDFGVIVEGELCLVLDSGEVVLKAGDTFVQRHTNHGWINRAPHRCRMAVVLIDGKQ